MGGNLSSTARRMVLVASVAVTLAGAIATAPADTASSATGELKPAVRQGYDPRADEVATEALNRSVPEVRLEAASLGDVVDFLRDVSNVKVEANWDALQTVGVTRKTPITCKVREVFLHNVLQTVLNAADSEHRIGFVVEGGMIVISATNDLEGSLQTRVYSVAELLPLVSVGLETATPGAAAPSAEKLAQEIAEVIRRSVMTDSWAERGGGRQATIQSSAANTELAIMQTRAGHAALQKLLGQARKALLPRITLECRFVCIDPAKVPSDVGESLGQSMIQRPRGREFVRAICLETEQASALMKAAGEIPLGVLGTPPRLTMLGGTEAMVEVKTSASCISGYVAEKDAKGQTEYRPVVNIADEGLVVFVKADARAGKDTWGKNRRYVELHVVPRLANELRGLAQVHAPNPLPQSPAMVAPRFDEPYFETSTMILDQQTLVLGGFAEMQVDGDAHPLRHPTTAQPGKAAGKWLPIFLLIQPTILPPAARSRTQAP